MASSVLLGPVAKYRVSDAVPASTTPGLDVDRCAALHNTLILYGWACSGKKVPDMRRMSWWSRHGSSSLAEILRPDLVRYLSKVFDVPGHAFFYHISGLARPPDMLRLGLALEEPERDTKAKGDKFRFIVLYNTARSLVSQPAGLVYDQETGLAILMPTYHHVFKLTDRTLPWQRLEVVLSVCFDMIEAEKAVAVMDSYGESLEASEPESLAAKRWAETHPWLLQPYTMADLTGCIDAWKRLVGELERRAKIEPDENPLPMCSNSALNAAGFSHGFAWQLLRHVPGSEITFVAPGIRLPKTEEFLHQPFKPVLEQFPKETEGMKMPFLFLRCPGTVSAKDAKFRWPFSTVQSVPCGLYLDAFPNKQNAFEDASRLVLPISLGGARYAQTSDFRPIRRSHSDLYQVEINPFVMRHGPKLVGILENWIDNIKSGHWRVNEKGVQGGVGEWRKADTREDWWRYQANSKYLYA